MIFISCFILASVCSAAGPQRRMGGGERVGRGDVDINVFYDTLAPYGNWVEDSAYGYVWCPTGLGYGWHPYSDGQWVWTDDGWTWASDLDWGWIPFHYGRWDFDDSLGWFWIPDTVWGPAWVTWCWGNDYVGWAPLPPFAEFAAGVGIRGFSRPLPDRFWCFIDGGRFLDRDLRRDIFPYERNRALLGLAIHRGNLEFSGERLFNGGIGVEDVRRWTGRQVTRYRLEDAERPGMARIEGGALRIYHPPILRSESVRPSNFVPRSEASRALEERQRQYYQQSGRESAAERALTNNQARERQLLDQSHQKEQQQMMLRRQEEINRTANRSEHERIQREYQSRQQELQRQHEEERSQMSQRHAQEQQSHAAPQGGGHGRH